MRLDVRRYGQLGEDLARDADSLHDIAQAAVVDTTEHTLRAMRLQVATRLGNSAANTVGRRYFTSRDQSVVGFVHSRWWVRTAGGKKIDLLAEYETGATITAKRGKWLAIPLPAAGNRARGRRRMTPERWEEQNDQDLHFVQRAGRNPLLVARRVGLNRGGIAVQRVRNRSTGRLIRRASRLSVPIFVLVRSSRLPKRLNFQPVRQESESRLARNLVVRLAQAGL